LVTAFGSLVFGEPAPKTMSTIKPGLVNRVFSFRPITVEQQADNYVVGAIADVTYALLGVFLKPRSHRDPGIRCC
jgi:hypothetical protein